MSRRLAMPPFLSWFVVLLLLLLYLVEITRKITLTEDSLLLEKAFMRNKVIPLNTIDGLYIYSWNKKFLNKKAFTTKLIVVAGSKKYKYTLSGIEVKAVLNMMKENFGINEYKMFVACKELKI